MFKFLTGNKEEKKIKKESKKLSQKREVNTGITSNNSIIKLYVDGKEAFPALENLIKSAKKTIYFETFHFYFDETGKRIAKLLGSRKKEGLEVKVIVDAIGLQMGDGADKIIDLLEEEGIEVRIFNKEMVSKKGITITHRKIYMADGQRVMIGGMNIGENYEKKWHDLLVEIEGEAVREIEQRFLEDWINTGGEVPEQIPEPEKKSYGNNYIDVIITNVLQGAVSHEIHQAMLREINEARKSIYVTSPYFSNDQIVESLIKAKKRGVDVLAIITEHNDQEVFKYLNLDTAEKLVKNGIEVYFYKPVFSHTKALIIDDKSFVGSANLDDRSFSGNQELCTMIKSDEFANMLYKRLFEEDLKLCRKAKPEDFDFQPVKKATIKGLDIVDYYL